MSDNATAESIEHLTAGMAPLDLSRETGLLVVLPHPDDESFAAGGTIALFADAGLPVMYLCGTYGDAGRRMGSPFFANRESLRDIRLKELTDACRVLGCDFRMMGLRDKTVEFEDPEAVAAQIREAIIELEPSTVITFYPGHGVHPDHDALGHATQLAVQGTSEPRPQLLAVAVGNKDELKQQLGEADVYSDIRSVADRKLDALRAHCSQTQAMFQHMEAETTDVLSSDFSEQMTVLEKFYRLPVE
jgi:bacillithiol biosynthesis deacetylase BshB2